MILYPKKAQIGLKTQLIKDSKSGNIKKTIKTGKALTKKGWQTKVDLAKKDIKTLSSSAKKFKPAKLGENNSVGNKSAYESKSNALAKKKARLKTMQKNLSKVDKPGKATSGSRKSTTKTLRNL